MDGGYVALATGLVMLGWFAIKQYIDKQDALREIDRLKEKVTELKEFIKDSK